MTQAMARLEEVARDRGPVRVYMDWVYGRIRLRDPDPPRSWYEALLRPDYSLWLYTLYALTLASLAAVWLGGVPALAGAFLLVFFLPGHALVKLLYPGGRLKPLEELGLSIVLSIAIVPVVGLVLNYTPLGIRPVPSAILLALVAFLGGLAGHRREYLLSWTSRKR